MELFAKLITEFQNTRAQLATVQPLQTYLNYYSLSGQVSQMLFTVSSKLKLQMIWSKDGVDHSLQSFATEQVVALYNAAAVVS